MSLTELITTESVTILVDKSPPETGFFLEVSHINNDKSPVHCICL